MQVQTGQRVVLVRCEEVDISGSFIRNKLLYMSILRKKMNSNPSLGPYHFRSPYSPTLSPPAIENFEIQKDGNVDVRLHRSRVVWRAIRGMMQHKRARFAAALERIKVHTPRTNVLLLQPPWSNTTHFPAVDEALSRCISCTSNDCSE